MTQPPGAAAALKARATELEHTSKAGDVFAAGRAAGLREAAEILEDAEQDAHKYAPQKERAQNTST